MTQRPSSPPRARQTVGELRCSGCGQAPGNPVHRADVAMTWLVAGIVGPVVRRFCRACIPAGRVDDVVCVRCGDGPLLAGELAGDGEQMPVAVQGWLSAAGWELSGPVCPGCVGELAR
jgi:hypothetical protein